MMFLKKEYKQIKLKISSTTECLSNKMISNNDGLCYTLDYYPALTFFIYYFQYVKKLR